MKKLSNKQRLGQINRNKKRLPKELKRKAIRKKIAISELKIKIAERRIRKYQRRLIQGGLRESRNTQ